MLDLQETLVQPADAHLRPLNPGRDLIPVADLIELCFANTMDPDGRDYLRQMRQAARDEIFLRWAPVGPESAQLGLGGFVWEENGAIIGNLSLIPMVKQSQRIYLIANVATHPDQRRRGIGRALTQAALDFARQHGAASAWLQVRQENLAALRLYENLGFVERSRRTNWINDRHSYTTLSSRQVEISPRRAADWPRQYEWLVQVYPRDVLWNLPIHPKRFKPGLLSGFTRFMLSERIEHWAARTSTGLLGIITWEPSRTYADNLWLAAPPATEDAAVASLLPSIRSLIITQRPLSLNYPSGRAVEALNAAGFRDTQTLIWMEKPLQAG